MLLNMEVNSMKYDYIKRIEKEIEDFKSLALSYNKEGKKIILNYINELIKTRNKMIILNRKIDKLEEKTMIKDFKNLMKKNEKLKNQLKEEIYLKSK